MASEECQYLYPKVNWALVIGHSALVLFNTLGWIVRRWRRANLVLLLLTGASWFGLGMFYGLGYCPLTDWHWAVLRRLGETDLPRSYIQYLLVRLLGVEFSAATVDAAVAVGFFAALLISVIANLRDWKKTRTTTMDQEQ